MQPLAQAMRTRHIISLTDRITAFIKKVNLSGTVDEQYLFSLVLRLLLFFGPGLIIETGILSRSCGIQQRKQQVTMHFEDLVLRFSHPKTLG